jgi:alkaline phosphatase D
MMAGTGTRQRANACSMPCAAAARVHTFYATDLRRDFNRPVNSANPVLAPEFCGTSVTSGSRAQARTLQYVDMNPHVKYGRSDKRGFMLMEITPAATNTFFMGLDDVRNPATGMTRLAAFGVEHGKPGARRIA